MTYVDADVNYLADLSIPPVTYNPPEGTGVPRRDGNYRIFKVRVHNARPYAKDLSLDKQAFILTHHDTKVRDFLRRGRAEGDLLPRGRGAGEARDRRVEGRRVRPHRAHRRARRRARLPPAGDQRAQRLHREVRPAARARPAAAGRGRAAAEEALRRIQRVAQHRSRADRDRRRSASSMPRASRRAISPSATWSIPTASARSTRASTTPITSGTTSRR